MGRALPELVSALSMALSRGSRRTLGKSQPPLPQMKYRGNWTELLANYSTANNLNPGAGEAEPEARHVYPRKCQESPGEHTIGLHHTVPPSRWPGNQMPGWKSTRRWIKKLQVSESPAQPYLLLQAIYASRHSLVSCQFPSTAVVCGCNAQHLSPLSPSRPAQKLDVQHVAVWVPGLPELASMYENKILLYSFIFSKAWDVASVSL